MDFSQQGGAATTRPQCCSYCKVLLGNGVRIVRELKQVRRLRGDGQSDLTVDRKSPSVCVCVLQEGQSGPGSSLLFCSPNCSTLYTNDLQSRSAGTKVRPRPHRRCPSLHLADVFGAEIRHRQWFSYSHSGSCYDWLLWGVGVCFVVFFSLVGCSPGAV